MIPYFDGEQIAFAANGELVTYNRQDDEVGMVRLWDPEDGRLISETPVPDLGLYRAIITQLSPDGRTVATADDMMIVFWDLYTGQEVLPRLEGFGGIPPAALAFSPDGQRFAAANYWDVRVRDLRGGEIVDTLYTGAHSWRVSSLAVSPDGTVASGAERSEVVIWKGEGDFLNAPQEATDFFSSQPIQPPDIAHTGWVYDVAFVNNGAQVVTYAQDDRLILWRADNRWPIEIVTGRQSPITGMASSPDGRLLVTLDRQNVVTVWSFTDYNRLLRPVVVADATNNVATGFAGEEHHLVAEAIRDDNSTRAFVWDVVTNRETSGLGPDIAPINWIRGSAAGDLFATEIGERVTVYNAASREPIREFDLNTVFFNGFSDDLRRVVVRESDDTLVLRDVITYDPIGTPLAGAGEVAGLALSPDARYLAYTSQDSNEPAVHIWNFETASDTLFPVPPAEEDFGGFVRLMAVFSPDSAAIVYGYGDVLTAATVESGEINRTFEIGWDVPVAALAWSADEDSVILAGRGVIPNVNDPRETLEYVRYGLAYVDSGEIVNLFESEGLFVDLLTSPNRDYMALLTFPPEFGSPRLFVGEISVTSMARLACRIVNRNLTQTEWTQYIGASQPYRETCAGLDTPASAAFAAAEPAPAPDAVPAAVPAATPAPLPTALPVAIQPTATTVPTPVPQVNPDILLTYNASVPVLYLTNVSGRSLNLEPLSFEGGGRMVDAETWYRSTLSQPLNSFEAGGCLGLWGLSADMQSPPSECGTRHGWWSSDNIVFWTEGSFTVRYGGEVVATCDTNAGRCGAALGG